MNFEKQVWVFFLGFMPLPSLKADEPIAVNAINFARAESDKYFSRSVKLAGGLATFYHIRQPTPIDKQDVVRMNRDTLYSAAVFDLDAGPVTITLPDTDKRFMSLMIVNQDHYAIETLYAPARREISRQAIGTRYFMAMVRTFMNPNVPSDVAVANRAQDSIKVDQSAHGAFEVPAWDEATHKTAREALISLSTLGGTKENRFGRKETVDPVSWLIGTAAGWGGNPREDAIYLPTFPAKNDGVVAYTLSLRDVPVDGFWSVTVYDREGFMFANDQQANSLNNLTAKPSEDGSCLIQFGGDPKDAVNFLAIKPGWNYVLRLYQPRSDVLDGNWKSPELLEKAN
jgi:hypothetical protein